MRFKAIFSLLIIGIASTFFSFNDVKEEKIEWITFEEAIELSKKKPKKVFIDLYTDWCGWCKRMDAVTFQNSVVASYMQENFYMVKLNAEQKDPITFKGHEFKFVASGRRGVHELAYVILDGKLSYPSVAFMDEKMNMIQAIPGFRKPEEFLMIATFMGDNHYKKTPWPDFQKSYKSPF